MKEWYIILLRYFFSYKSTPLSLNPSSKGRIQIDIDVKPKDAIWKGSHMFIPLFIHPLKTWNRPCPINLLICSPPNFHSSRPFTSFRSRYNGIKKHIITYSEQYVVDFSTPDRKQQYEAAKAFLIPLMQHAILHQIFMQKYLVVLNV